MKLGCDWRYCGGVARGVVLVLECVVGCAVRGVVLVLECVVGCAARGVVLVLEWLWAVLQACGPAPSCFSFSACPQAGRAQCGRHGQRGC